jgi:hypothetical protein
MLTHTPDGQKYHEIWSFRCYPCHITTHHLIAFSIGWELQQDGSSRPTREYLGSAIPRTCPSCSSFLELQRVVDPLISSRQCERRCAPASGTTECKCSCGGAAHGTTSLSTVA